MNGNFDVHVDWACQDGSAGNRFQITVDGKVTKVTCGLPTGSKTSTKPPLEVPEGFDYDLWLGPAPEAPYVPGRCRARGWYCIYDYCLGWISAWGSHVLSLAQWGYDTHKTGITEYEGTGELPKLGLNERIGKLLAGRVLVAPIGIPVEADRV